MKNLTNMFKKLLLNKNLISLIMAIFTYYFLCKYQILPVYNTISWTIFLLLVVFFRKTDIYEKEYKKEIIVLSAFFSFLTAYGNFIYAYNNIKEISIIEQLFRINTVIVYIGIFNLYYIMLRNIYPKLMNIKLIENKEYTKSSKFVFFTSFICIIICWLPYFLTFFPGTLSADSMYELSTVINNFSSVSDHHPVIHILFIALPYNIGYKISNNITIGVAFSTITQMIIMSSIFSSVIVFLHKRKINKIILLLVLLFYALVPMHGYYSVVMWKDVIFSGLLLLLTIQIIKIFEKEKENKLNIKNMISFIIVSVLCVFFRNNAIYMYFLLAFATLFTFKKYYKVFIPIFIMVFGIYFFVKGPVFQYFNITKSGSAEYIGIPLQQIGRMAYKNVDFSEEEKVLINKLIPIEILGDAYNPVISDTIKFNKKYNPKAFDENKLDYLKLWLTLIMKHPGIAVEAYSTSTLGYWYPGVEYWSVEKNIFENEYGLKIENKVPGLIKKCIYKIEDRKTPIFNIQWSIGLCFWIILLLGIICKKKNGIKYLLAYIPVLGIWLTLMVAAPVYAEFRYVYGAFTCLPLLMVVPYLKNDIYLEEEKCVKK